MKWLLAVMLCCAIPVQMKVHAQPVVLDLDAQPQKQPLWCWVAVSRMAIRSFPEDTDAIVANKRFRHFTQEEVYARAFLEVMTLEHEYDPDPPATAQTIKTKIDDQVAICKNDLPSCNERGQPMLYDIAYDVPPPDMALSIEAIKLDIDGKKPGQQSSQPAAKANGHPIVIQWAYGSRGCSTDDAVGSDESYDEPSFAHALIITGYDLDNQQLRIYDPLPVWSPNNPDELNERWIPFETYIDPGSDAGRAVAAVHQSDRYRMRRKGASPPAAKQYYKMVPAPATCPNQPDPGGFESEEALRGSIVQYMESRKGWFPDRDGRPRTGAISTGKPVPVVALGVNQLLDGTPLESLLDRRASAYVVPILEETTKGPGKTKGKNMDKPPGKYVVDSFLLLPKDGGWQQGGYSNNVIAYLLAELSERHKDKLQPGEVFYLVSIPEMASYFIAHGFKDKARLLSLNDADSRKFEDPKCAINEALANFHRVRKAPKPRPVKKFSISR